MLSICIPIYNIDVTGLVNALHKQTERINITFEIICIDDCSADLFREKNREVCTNYGTYIQLAQNIGRAKIRNLFLNYVKYNYLLYLDCDSVIVSNDFIKQYIDVIKEGRGSVICGGRIYDEKKPERQKTLQWYYGHYKESMPVAIRQLNPNRSFMTSNFVIHRNIFDQIKFEERLLQYGHEDTLFGFQLKKKHIPIIHVDNPILNGELENNAEFITKTELGLGNLINVLDYVNHDPEFIEDVSILNFYQKCSKKHITWIIVIIFSTFKPLLKFFLSIGFVHLLIFDFYKLGYFSKNYKKMQLGKRQMIDT
jgi:glycosyltransferase involved in cell wall biosynthesis